MPPTLTLFVAIILLLITTTHISHHTLATPLHDPPTPHFVLVHGMGHGAWCWYQVTSRLQAAGYSVTAIDLTSHGNSNVAADTVSSVAQFTAPLIRFLNATAHKVIVVGHSLGGSSLSYAMELLPEKISKAVFVAATMPSNGQLFMQDEQVLSSSLRSQVFVPIYANGRSAPFTSVYFNLTTAQPVLYNESPPEDITLAYTSLRPQPVAPLFETLNLTSTRYGSVERIYIKTTTDNLIPQSLQEQAIESNPPHRVLTVNSDHSPFFSHPGDLTGLLVSIASS